MGTGGHTYIHRKVAQCDATLGNLSSWTTGLHNVMYVKHSWKAGDSWRNGQKFGWQSFAKLTLTSGTNLKISILKSLGSVFYLD